MANDAAARSLVEATANPAHQRSSLIRLADRGRDTITAVIAREDSQLRQVRGDLTAADVDACGKVLSRMLEHIGDADIEP